MAVLEHLEPKSVFGFFEEMCGIPHGSTHTKEISDWLMDFAKARGLEAHQDALNNVIIIREATPGYEKAPTIILQGHMDMVCEKAPDCLKDMEKEGLDLAVEGDVVFAKGTTLGGDDGIAVAMALAVLDAEDLPHPRVEAVFTVDEEIGMLGAMDMDVSPLTGRQMLNLDTENEGVFTVSCAGGNTTGWTLPLTRAPFAGTALTVSVGGLIGGHSGIEIDKGRGNSNLLMGRVLYAVSREAEMRLVSVCGGLKHNAIPRETAAILVTTDPEAVRRVCRQLDEALKNEYRTTDPDVFVAVEAGEDALPMDAESTKRVLCFLTNVPDGIQHMSAEIPGLVQTSLNLGVVETKETALTGVSCMRSSVESQKWMMADRLRCLLNQLGGTIDITGDYGAWEYQQHSPLRELLTEVFREQQGHDPKVEAVHAGLECGVLISKMPGLDCVSLGPDLREIHTCQEKLYIGSVQRLWALLTETLRRMKE